MTQTAPRLRLGIAGLGMAGTIMARALKGWGEVAVTAAADRAQGLCRAFARDFNAETHADVAALAASDAVDAIYIATPHQFHAEHACLAAANGKHIVLEKPMALTLSECDAIIEATDKAGVKLVVGPTHAYDPAIRLMQEIVAGGELGRLSMINTWDYNDFLYRPRRPEELDTDQGGGIIFNQLPHQIDSIRVLGGGELKSVRAALAVLDPDRPTEGAATAFLQFAGGAAATLVYSGYDRFDTDVWHGWIGEGGQFKDANGHGRARERLGRLSQAEEARLRTETFGYKSGAAATEPAHPPHFGVMVVSCEKGDMKPSPAGLTIYDDGGLREIEIPAEKYPSPRRAVIAELTDALSGTPAPHDGPWGKATLEVALAIQESARLGKEIFLAHQTLV